MKKFGVKPSGYQFQVEILDKKPVRVTVKMLKDGAWTFYNKEYQDKKDLDLCMAFATMFLLETNGNIKLSTVGVEDDLEMMEIITKYAVRLSKNRLSMTRSTQRLILKEVVQVVGEEEIDSPFLRAFDTNVFKYTSTSATTLNIDDPRVQRAQLFGEETVEDE